MARASIFLLVALTIATVTGCSAGEKTGGDPLKEMPIKDQIRLAAYNHTQAVINHNGRELCDSIDKLSVNGLIVLGRKKNWPGSEARSKQAIKKNCPRVADALIDKLNNSKKERAVYRNMAEQITKTQKIKITKKNQAEIVIPRVVERNGRWVEDPDGGVNTLKLAYQNGRWVAAQCKWNI